MSESEEPAPAYVWRIVSESSPGLFTATGQEFTGTIAEVEAFYLDLQATSGIMHGAEVIRPA